MHYEIERKFLIDSQKLPELPEMGRTLIQGYITQPEDSREVRLRDDQGEYTLTIKDTKTFMRQEYQQTLEKEQFDQLWTTTENRIIVKDRYNIPFGTLIIDLDIYKNELQGLIMVEVEFESVEQAKAFEPLDWFGAEVTHQHEFDNRHLAVHGMETIKAGTSEG